MPVVTNMQVLYDCQFFFFLCTSLCYSFTISDSSSFIYTRPILLQHFPLYRTSDSNCPTKPIDAMPKHLRAVLNRPKVDCLSKEATKQVCLVFCISSVLYFARIYC
ncbi:unnamed protein product [Heterobilharzia americana]|nr:unnamed protein product [Heterobilharzia americana]